MSNTNRILLAYFATEASALEYQAVHGGVISDAGAGWGTMRWAVYAA